MTSFHFIVYIPWIAVHSDILTKAPRPAQVRERALFFFFFSEFTAITVCITSFEWIMYKQSPRLWQPCNWKVYLSFHCFVLGIDGGWISSWSTEASSTYRVLLARSLFLIVFKWNVSWLSSWTWRCGEQIFPLELQRPGRDTSPSHWPGVFPFALLGDGVTLRWQGKHPWASPMREILLVWWFLWNRF